MGYKPDPNWPAEVEKEPRPGVRVTIFFAPEDGGPTQTAEYDLGESYRGLLMVTLNGQTVYSNDQALAAGVVDTVEEKKEVTDGK